MGECYLHGAEYVSHCHICSGYELETLRSSRDALAKRLEAARAVVRQCVEALGAYVDADRLPRRPTHAEFTAAHSALSAAATLLGDKDA